MRYSIVATALLATVQAQSGPVDPSTTKDCTFYDTAADPGYDCAYFEDIWQISHADFVKWNPSVKQDCSGLKQGNSYCVEAYQTSTTETPTTTPTPTGTPKPSPTQDGLISSCVRFYKAVTGDSCTDIVNSYGTFTLENFVKWNPAANSDCSGLLAGYYYCVGVPGTPTTKPKPTSTSATGPSPTQSGLIKTCKNFYKAKTGDTCDKIISAYGTFTTADFIKWNPAVKSDCSGLLAGYYYCVGIPGTPTSKPTSKPTSTCNPKAPEPTQPGVVCSCTKWHKVGSGTTCDGIISYEHITPADFYKWNPKVGKDCSSLWAGYYVCVGTKGSTTVKPTTKPPQETCNPTAPKPTQPGAVCRCKKWHIVSNKSTTCDSIIKYEKITKANFFKWNPKIKKDCTNLLLGYNVCVKA